MNANITVFESAARWVLFFVGLFAVLLTLAAVYPRPTCPDGYVYVRGHCVVGFSP